MNFVEKNRNVEPHAESILFLYLQDANGAPAPNKKVKVFAGPPPTGEPPYFVDDDPNNPNRRTDSNGKFQFIVANGPPLQRLDFWVQVLGDDGAPAGKPFQFPFPAGEARWVIVTAAPEGSVSGDPNAVIPTPDLQLDPRLAAQANVRVQPAQLAANTPYWKLISAQYQDPDESGGNVNIVVFVQDERGAPMPGQRVFQKFPGDRAPGITDERGHIEFPMSGDSSFAPERGESGPYSVEIDGLPNDQVLGMGLPLRRHVQYILTYRRALFSPQPTPTPAPVPTPPTPTPPAPATPQPQPAPMPAGNLRGRITNAAAGARLVLKTAGRTLDALVATDGLYSFTNVPAGSYALELSGVGIINPAINITANQTLLFDYPVSSPAPAKKVLKHYLLFGPGTQAGTMTHLILALDYIVHFAPIVGFSADEALNAERVTIVGGASAVSAQDEQRLRESGCKVARLQAPDSFALENLFQQLLASGSPFPS
jgi:hypothetical protein